VAGLRLGLAGGFVVGLSDGLFMADEFVFIAVDLLFCLDEL